MRQFFFSCLLGIGLTIYGSTGIGDWKGFPMTGSKVQIPLNLVYAKEEFALIAQGFIPRGMDDRWIMVREGEHLLFYRSWTGVMIYDCLFNEREDDVLIISMDVNRNLADYSNSDDDADIFQIKHLLGWLVSFVGDEFGVD